MYTFFLKCITIHHLKFWPWGTLHFPLTLWPFQSRDPSLPSFPGPQGRIFHTSPTQPTKRPKDAPDALCLSIQFEFFRRRRKGKALKISQPFEFVFVFQIQVTKGTNDTRCKRRQRRQRQRERRERPFTLFSKRALLLAICLSNLNQSKR